MMSIYLLDKSTDIKTIYKYRKADLKDILTKVKFLDELSAKNL